MIKTHCPLLSTAKAIHLNWGPGSGGGGGIKIETMCYFLPDSNRVTDLAVNTSGLYYKHVTIVNDASCGVNK
jgi:hypothetical protein